jgi:hypothetical protein
MTDNKDKDHEKQMAKKFSPVSESAEKKKDSGKPGGGAGRVEEVKGSGVYPASGPLPEDNAPYEGQMSFGQGQRGEAGYYDSGDSEIMSVGGVKDTGGANQQTEKASKQEREAAKRSNEKEKEI